MELIAKNGYNKVSMDEIAARSGITKRTLYKYFPSKYALLLHIFEHYLKAIYDMSTLRASRMLPAEQFVQEMLRELFHFSTKNFTFMKLFWMLDSSEAEGDAFPALKEHIRLWNSNILQVSAGALRRAGMTGWFANFTPEEVVEMTSALNKGMMIQLNKDRQLNLNSVKSERFVHLFMGLLELAARADVPKPKRLAALLAEGDEDSAGKA